MAALDKVVVDAAAVLRDDVFASDVVVAELEKVEDEKRCGVTSTGDVSVNVVSARARPRFPLSPSTIFFTLDLLFVF